MRKDWTSLGELQVKVAGKGTRSGVGRRVLWEALPGGEALVTDGPQGIEAACRHQ